MRIDQDFSLCVLIDDKFLLVEHLGRKTKFSDRSQTDLINLRALWLATGLPGWPWLALTVLSCDPFLPFLSHGPSPWYPRSRLPLQG